MFGKPDMEGLWDAVATATRLDAEDIVEAWHEHAAMLQTRVEALNARAFDAIRFRGPGTDLTIGLNDGALWVSATNQDCRRDSAHSEPPHRGGLHEP